MSNTTTANTFPEFEFQYDVKMVKTYYDTATITTRDFIDRFEDLSAEVDVGKNASGKTVCLSIEWKDLTHEERLSLLECASKTYSYCDQYDAEARGSGYEYEGEVDDDERFDDGTPDTVIDCIDDCWNEWFDALGNKAKVAERILNTEHIFKSSPTEGDTHVYERLMTYRQYLLIEDYDGKDAVQWVSTTDCECMFWEKPADAPAPVKKDDGKDALREMYAEQIAECERMLANMKAKLARLS